MKKVGIFAPARLSSERLPGKQLLPIGDSCMFDLCCNRLNKVAQSGIPCYVLISDDELITIAKKYENIHIVFRDPETSNSDGPLRFIFKDIINTSHETHLMFLNPCLIFLKPETIIECVHNFEESDFDYATSVKPLQNWVLSPNGTPLCSIDYLRLSTKEIEPLYEFANAFHIFNRKNFEQDGMELKDGFGTIVISSALECIDIDTREDYEYAKWRYGNINKTV